MSESSLDKTARALDLVPYILEHQGISLEELARAFGISSKQIYEDLNLLFCCGLPGYSPLELIDMNFEDGFVTVSDPQKFDRPRKLSKSETTALLIGLDVLSSISSPKLLRDIQILKSKLMLALNTINSTFIVPGERSIYIEKIQDAIAGGLLLDIQYTSANSDAISTRTISPISITVQNGNIYLLAWCELAKAERTFRLDRVSELEISSKPIKPITPKAEHKEFGEPIKLLVHNSAKRFIEENLASLKLIESDPAGKIVQLDGVKEEWILRTIRGYLGHIQVLAPQSLVDKLQDRYKGTLARYLEN